MKRSWSLIAILMIAVSFSGCSLAVLESSHSPNGQVSQPGSIGYFLPKGLVHFSVTGSQAQGWTIVASSKIVPDRGQFYTLTYNASPLSDDQVKINVSTEGLLESIDVTVADKTGDIIVKLAQLAKEAAKLSALGLEGRAPKPKELVLDQDIDPDNSEELKNLNEKLKIFGLKAIIDPLGHDMQINSGPRENRGVYYRPLIPYRVTISTLEGAEKMVCKSEILSLPNGAPIMAVDVTRACLVTKVTKLTFDKGTLKAVDINKPSEVSALVDIPINVVKEVVSIPGELIKFKIDTSKSATDFYTQKLAEEKARDELINYIKEREQKR